MVLSWKYFLFLVLGFSLVISVSRVAAEDDTDDETIDAEGEGQGEGSETTEETEEAPKLTSSTEAETSILFVKPALLPEANVELPAGKLVEIIVGFHNKANYDFVVDALDASFRFPMDYNYHMQNFTAVSYDFTVKPNQHGSILYAFMPHEAFGSRSYGLTVQLTYHDLDGNYFRDAVFNQTIPIVEVDEGLDTETFFLYVFLAGFLVLLMVLGSQFLSWGKKKTIGSSKSSKPRSTLETGTKQADDVDFDWIPKEALQERSPKTPTRSPRARKARKGTPVDSE